MYLYGGFTEWNIVKSKDMVKSMTGFGKVSVAAGNKKIMIEVKSLNSKQLDLSLRMPNLYREKEMEIRNMVRERLERGKVEMSICFDSSEGEKEVAVNRSVVLQYFGQMLEVCARLGVEPDRNGLLQTVMRFPDTLQQKAEEPDEQEWLCLKQGIEEALEETDRFRIQEGKALVEDIVYRIGLIRQLSEQIPQFEGRRVELVRQRLAEKLREWCDAANIDQNRLEQEIVYYLEKLDITEEKVRLANHCRYFLETMEREKTPGRKFGFIAQEIGREINTMGSKANDHDIQKLVVRMKDELEKIKEQSLNVL